MASSKNPLPILTLIFFLLVFVAVFLVNHWIAQEVDRAGELRKRPAGQSQLQKIPSRPIAQSKTSAQEMIQSEPENDLSKQPAESFPESSKEKIIYETPLDDVILVQ